jgi:hypothetical protein
VFEPLEARRLFAATLNELGTLVVGGTDGPDVIRVWTRGDTVVVRDNGQVTTFPAADVRGVMVMGLGGNDRVNCRGVSVNCQILGGEGDDVLAGGRGSDEISGHDGHDRLYGMAGDDFMYDSDGDDRFLGGAGDDEMRDGGGFNRFVGGGGADSGSYVEGRTRLAGVESTTLLPTPVVVHPSPDAVVVTFRRDDRGRWLADVEVTVPDPGHVLSAGRPTRAGNDIVLPIVLEDLQTGSVDLVDVKRETIDLGRLAPGTYQCTVSSGGQAVVTLSFLVA